ncbi:MAG: MMPL family transporter [Methylococcaceae bacterium]|nr:MMPL family transporter [Methylococcaceae bacterium]
MSNPSSSMFDTFLCWWGVKILRYPWLLILFTFLICGASLHYTMNNLGVNTNTAEMLSQDLPFQKNRKRVEAEFPQDANAIIMVVEARTPEETSLAANSLAQQLQLQPEFFESVYIPTENDFFKQQALLYLDEDELAELAQKLTEAQPFIGHLAQNYHLQGLFSIITQALKQEDNDLPMDLNPLLKAINQSFEEQLKGNNYHLSWQDLLAAKRLNTDTKRTIVMVKPKLNYDEILPAEHALTVARKTVRQMLAQNSSLNIRMTGEVALEHEELESVTEGAAIAGIVSFVLVITSLWFGLRSIKLLFATLIALIAGLILTAGFATLAIGHLNLISIAFAVLYIGLGVDYAIHICLHYRECRANGLENKVAITESIHTVGFSIFLCAVTTSMGFLAFIPTDYSGVSELGIISGMGMFIGLAISLTLIPALLTVFVIKEVKPLPSASTPLAIANFPFQFAKPIRIVAIALAVLSPLVLTQLTFDSNPINLRDPSSESVVTVKELLRSKNDSPFTLSTLSNDLSEAQSRAEKLSNLKTVHEAITLSDLVATNQEEKLFIIEDLDLILGNQLSQFKPQAIKPDTRSALLEFQREITEVLKKQPQHPAKINLEKLAAQIHAFVRIADNHAKVDYPMLEDNILGLLPYTMERLRMSLTAYPYELKDLPETVTQHWKSPNGLYRILITPEFDQNIPENQKHFVEEVQSIDNTVTGLSVADQASGIAVVNAFIEAFAGALIAIVVLLLLILRNIKNTLLVVCPLILAALLTGASNVLLNNPFNFANIIALPLLMGMGVDSGVHIMHRLHAGLNNGENLLQSSTARGVFFSSLTTMCSFSSLAFTPHVGTASMGLLLALGIFFTLICTLIILPAFSGKKVA